MVSRATVYKNAERYTTAVCVCLFLCINVSHQISVGSLFRFWLLILVAVFLLRFAWVNFALAVWQLSRVRLLHACMGKLMKEKNNNKKRSMTEDRQDQEKYGEGIEKVRWCSVGTRQLIPEKNGTFKINSTAN